MLQPKMQTSALRLHDHLCRSPYHQIPIRINGRASTAFEALSRLYQESPNFFVRGPRKLSHNNSKAGHLTQWDCSGYVTFYKSVHFS